MSNSNIPVTDRERPRSKPTLLHKVKNKAMQERHHLDEEFYPEDSYGEESEAAPVAGYGGDAESTVSEEELLKKCKLAFEKDIKVDLIDGVDLRIMCRFLGISAVNDIKEHDFKEVPLITSLVMQSIENYMASKGYAFTGEMNFDMNGKPTPTQKQVWTTKGEEVSFTVNGYVYYEKLNSSNRNDNVSFLVYTDKHNNIAQISCFTNNEKRSEKIILDLVSFAKKNNCLRGVKLKNVDLINSSFEEIISDPKYAWDNYYFPDDVRKVFEEEIFGFLRNIKEYNKYGIVKRGYILHGEPGCVLKETKIKVRKKKKEGKHRILNQ
tara:strand:+ start:188 stop:1156 length:969 start_codon:yes stop_codon:yes gene_type:complete